MAVGKNEFCQGSDLPLLRRRLPNYSSVANHFWIKLGVDKLNILCYNKGTKTKEDNKMMNYLFVDIETGERFFVQANSFKEAEEIAYDNFDDPEYIDEFTDAEAEWFGYDTY